MEGGGGARGQGGGGVEGRVSKAHHYEFFALQRRGLAADNAEGIYEVHGKKLPPMFLSSNNGYFRIYHPLINGVQMGRANK